jgi:hypothetical protein
VSSHGYYRSVRLRRRSRAAPRSTANTTQPAERSALPRSVTARSTPPPGSSPAGLSTRQPRGMSPCLSEALRATAARRALIFPASHLAASRSNARMATTAANGTRPTRTRSSSARLGSLLRTQLPTESTTSGTNRERSSNVPTARTTRTPSRTPSTRSESAAHSATAFRVRLNRRSWSRARRFTGPNFSARARAHGGSARLGTEARRAERSVCSNLTRTPYLSPLSMSRWRLIIDQRCRMPMPAAGTGGTRLRSFSALGPSQAHEGIRLPPCPDLAIGLAKRRLSRDHVFPLAHRTRSASAVLLRKLPLCVRSSDAAERSIRTVIRCLVLAGATNGATRPTDPRRSQPISILRKPLETVPHVVQRDPRFGLITRRSQGQILPRYQLAYYEPRSPLAGA